MESCEVTLSRNEINFIVKMLSQLTINPASAEAIEIVGYVHSIISKLTKDKL